MKVLIVGRAFGVWTQVEEAKQLGTFDSIICINVSGRDYPGKFDHWVTFHPELMDLWIRQRMAEGRPGGMKLWTATHRNIHLGKEMNPALNLNHIVCEGGSSGMLGVQVALEKLDATKIVLCGIPMENIARYDDASAWAEAEQYKGAWEDYFVKADKRKVRSLSGGYTERVFGRADKEWFNATSIDP